MRLTRSLLILIFGIIAVSFSMQSGADLDNAKVAISQEKSSTSDIQGVINR